MSVICGVKGCNCHGAMTCSVAVLAHDYGETENVGGCDLELCPEHLATLDAVIQQRVSDFLAGLQTVENATPPVKKPVKTCEQIGGWSHPGSTGRGFKLQARANRRFAHREVTGYPQGLLDGQPSGRTPAVVVVTSSATAAGACPRRRVASASRISHVSQGIRILRSLEHCC